MKRDDEALEAAVGAAPGASPGAEMPIRVRWQDSRNGWSWRIKLLRVAWAPCRIVFLRGTGRYLSPLRVAVLRLFGARIDAPVLVMDGVKVWYPWNLRLGRECRIGSGVEIYNFAPVEIGEQAAVSQGSYLCTASHDHTDPTMPLVYRPIVVAPEAWVCARCLIGPGVTIGRGAVTGAGSVVMRDVAPWQIVAGNPAVPRGRRRLAEPGAAIRSSRAP